MCGGYGMIFINGDIDDNMKIGFSKIEKQLRGGY